MVLMISPEQLLAMILSHLFRFLVPPTLLHSQLTLTLGHPVQITRTMFVLEWVKRKAVIVTFVGSAAIRAQLALLSNQSVPIVK